MGVGVGGLNLDTGQGFFVPGQGASNPFVDREKIVYLVFFLRFVSL